MHRDRPHIVQQERKTGAGIGRRHRPLRGDRGWSGGRGDRAGRQARSGGLPRGGPAGWGWSREGRQWSRTPSPAWKRAARRLPARLGRGPLRSGRRPAVPRGRRRGSGPGRGSASRQAALDDLPSAMEAFEEIANRLEEVEPAIFFDYDGTLSPIVEHPDLAVLAPSMLVALERLLQPRNGGDRERTGRGRRAQQGEGGRHLLRREPRARHPRPLGGARPRRPP